VAAIEGVLFAERVLVASFLRLRLGAEPPVSCAAKEAASSRTISALVPSESTSASGISIRFGFTRAANRANSPAGSVRTW
jgi:hypothetical protein